MPSPLPPDVLKRLKEALTLRVLPMFPSEGKGKGQSAAARAMSAKTGKPVAPATINRILKDNRGGSLEFVRIVAQFLNEDPDLILNGPSAKRPSAKKLKELPGYAEAFSEAQRRAAQEHPGISPLALKLAGEATVTPQPERVSAGLLIQMALASPSAVSNSAALKR